MNLPPPVLCTGNPASISIAVASSATPGSTAEVSEMVTEAASADEIKVNEPKTTSIGAVRLTRPSLRSPHRFQRLPLVGGFLSGSLCTTAPTPALCRKAVRKSVGRPCLRNRSRNASSAISWKSIMRSRASRSSAWHVSASNCTRLPGIALDRPFVMGVKELRQLLAQAFVALGLVSPQHGLLEQAMLDLLRQLAPQIERREAERGCEPFDAVVPGHVANKS